MCSAIRNESWVMFSHFITPNYIIKTLNEQYQSSYGTGDHLLSRVSARLFGPHPSAIAVFTPAQKILSLIQSNQTSQVWIHPKSLTMNSRQFSIRYITDIFRSKLKRYWGVIPSLSPGSFIVDGLASADINHTWIKYPNCCYFEADVCVSRSSLIGKFMKCGWILIKKHVSFDQWPCVLFCSCRTCVDYSKRNGFYYFLW